MFFFLKNFPLNINFICFQIIITILIHCRGHRKIQIAISFPLCFWNSGRELIILMVELIVSCWSMKCSFKSQKKLTAVTNSSECQELNPVELYVLLVSILVQPGWGRDSAPSTQSGTQAPLLVWLLPHPILFQAILDAPGIVYADF